MAFLVKKQKSSPAAASERRVAAAVSHDQLKSLVFGVTWRSVASRSNGRADATKLARKAKASHLIYKQQQYGFAVVPSTALGQLYPAAQVAARQNGGDALYVLKISDGEYWIAVVRGSQPSEFDRVFHYDSDDEAIEAGHSELTKAAEDSVSLRVFTNLADASFPGSTFLPLEDLLQAAAGDEDKFSALPKGQTTIPKPLLVCVAVGLVAVAGNKGWSMYQQHERQRLAALNIVVEEAPEAAWARAFQTWEAGRVAQDARGLAAARVSLGSTPVLWGGWYLQAASCAAVAAPPPVPGMEASTPMQIAKSRAWNCSATYQRLPVGALNRDMEAKALPGWTIQYKGLEQIVAAWRLEQPISQFKVDELQPTSFHQVETISRLQKLLPAISQVNAPAFVSAPIAPPKKSDGTAVPMPPGVPQVMEAEVSLKAPLRSVDALIEGGIAADWTQISIAFAPGSSDSSLSVRGSALSADVRGVIYAKN